MYTAANGKRYQANCDGFYPIANGGLVGSGNYVTLNACLDACSTTTDCIYADYDSDSGLCDFANNEVNTIQPGLIPECSSSRNYVV